LNDNSLQSLLPVIAAGSLQIKLVKNQHKIKELRTSVLLFFLLLWLTSGRLISLLLQKNFWFPNQNRTSWLLELPDGNLLIILMVPSY